MSDLKISNNNFINNTITNTKKSVEDTNFEGTLKTAINTNDKIKLKESCQQFEAILLNMMYKNMKATIMKSELIPKSAGEETFQEMLDEKLMEESSKTNSLGLSDMLYKQLIKNIDNNKNERD